jgi:hypothetical protein
MDPEQRTTIFEDSLALFFDNRDDALWLFETVRRKLKDDYPDLQLTQREQGEMAITANNNRIEGNVWRRTRVDPHVCKSDNPRR